MKRAWLNLRYTVPERRAIFTEGLERVGYQVVNGLTTDPAENDILVTWNRIHEGDTAAKAFEARGNRVLVAENASWGNEFAGKHWYTLTRNYHNVAKTFPEGGSERWDRLGVVLEPWRSADDFPETVILPSRGIGPACRRMPANWLERARSSAAGSTHVRVRAHPGRAGKAQRGSLRDELARAGRCITWGSGAAVKALLWGIRVESHMPQWIAEQDNTDEGRLAMFRRLAWSQWTLNDFASGYAFARLIA